MTTQQNSPAPMRNRIPLPPALERLAIRIARLPWWMILIALGLVAAFLAFATSDFYGRALRFVTDSPQLITTEYLNVTYEVANPDGTTRRVRGVLTAQDETTVTVKTQAEALVTLPEDDYTGLVCQTDGCAAGEQVSVVRTAIGGKLLFEDLGRFQLRTDDGLILDVRKFTTDTNSQVRTPEGCSANPEGNCYLRVSLNPDEPTNQIRGLLQNRELDALVIQIAPALFETINRADIQRTVSSEPAQCALNNIAACNEGIFMTMSVTVIAFLLACMVGLLVALMRISSNPVLYNLSTVYVEVVRGIPMVVILLLVGFAVRPWLRDEFPTFAPNLQTFILAAGGLWLAYVVYTRFPYRQTFPGEIIRPALVVVVVIGLLYGLVAFIASSSNVSVEMGGVLGLAFGFGAYLAELFRAGIQSIGRGQTEAARSLGMGYVQSMRYVILPQAFRVVLPPLGNELIAMLKDSSLITILAINEMTQKARLFAADTLRPFQAYITIAVLYLIMTLVLSFVVRVAEHRVALPK